MDIRCAGCGTLAGTGEPDDIPEGWACYVNAEYDPPGWCYGDPLPNGFEYPAEALTFYCSPLCLASHGQAVHEMMRDVHAITDGPWHD
jgi:hypothetical protein